MIKKYISTFLNIIIFICKKKNKFMLKLNKKKQKIKVYVDFLLDINLKMYLIFSALRIQLEC